MATTEHRGEPADFRRTLRRQCLAARDAMGGDDREVATAAILRLLDEFFSGRSPASLGFCLPLGSECDLRPFAAALADRGWQLAVPVAAERAAPMGFRHWTATAPLALDRHGISIPATAAVVPPDWLLLPVVAVDSAGYRLGYGGGYFDRTLAALQQAGRRPLTLGVGFATAQVADIRPAAHDWRLDWLVTDAGVTRFA